MRGEKVYTQVLAAFRAGSPPHARGKDVQSICMHIENRITPACAGKRELSFDADDRYGDHPRMRGEKACKSSICAQSMGSPPHARGKAEQLLNSDLWKGITPACAGKSIFILYFLYIL